MSKILLVLTLFGFLALPLVGLTAIEIKNPLKYDTIEDLIRAIIRFLQVLALIVTAIVIVAAGYFFVFSQGDPAKVTQARNMVIYALVGLAIILVAQGIIAVIERVIKG